MKVKKIPVHNKSQALYKNMTKKFSPIISATTYSKHVHALIEGPKMNWTVNDSLYHRFLKWHLKCENILECELMMLPERRKCKKVIAWSGRNLKNSASLIQKK